MNFKEKINNSDMVCLKYTDLNSIEKWLRDSVRNEYLLDINDDNTINTRLFLEFFKEALYENAAFKQITVVLIDSNELEMEINACDDVIANNGTVDALKDSTLSFLMNMVSHISMPVLQSKLGINSKLARVMPKERILEKLVTYIQMKKGNLTLLHTPLYYQYYHLNFVEHTISYGYLDKPVYFYGDLTKNSSNELYTYAEKKHAINHVSTIGFDKAIDLLTHLESIHDEMLKNQKGSFTPTSPKESAQFYEKSNLVKIIYFMKYVTLVKPIKKVISNKKTTSQRQATSLSSVKSTHSIERINYYYEAPDCMDEEILTEAHDTLKKHFNYTRQSWTTRGHFRTYKNGHKVWIKPTVRKRKTALLKPDSIAFDPKTYISQINKNDTKS